MGNKNQNTQLNNVSVKDSTLKISEKNRKAIDLLDSWIEDGNKQEQTETWEYLKKELDETVCPTVNSFNESLYITRLRTAWNGYKSECFQAKFSLCHLAEKSSCTRRLSI